MKNKKNKTKLFFFINFESSNEITKIIYKFIFKILVKCY